MIANEDSVEYQSFFPESLIELHRYIPEIKDTCITGNATAYININPVTFADARDTITRIDDFSDCEILKKEFIKRTSRNNVVIDLADRSTESYKQVIDIVKKYTDKYYRLDNFEGQSVVVWNSNNIEQLLTEISNIGNCTISYNVVLFGKRKE